MSMQHLGGRIRKRRESLGILMNDLAAQIGVSSSLISQIERTKAYPSILTLKKIADALRTSVGELIGENESVSAHPLMQVKERKFVRSNPAGTRVYLLSHHDPIKIMDPFLMVFKPGGHAGGIMTTMNPRQEFCQVLQGRFTVSWGGQEFSLNEGDSFYFISDQPHTFVNTSDKEAQLLWVVNHGNN